MKEIFNYFDKDKDGLIDLDDIDKVCQIINIDFNKDEIAFFLQGLNPKFV